MAQAIVFNLLPTSLGRQTSASCMGEKTDYQTLLGDGRDLRGCRPSRSGSNAHGGKPGVSDLSRSHAHGGEHVELHLELQLHGASSCSYKTAQGDLELHLQGASRSSKTAQGEDSEPGGDSSSSHAHGREQCEGVSLSSFAHGEDSEPGGDSSSPHAHAGEQLEGVTLSSSAHAGDSPLSGATAKATAPDSMVLRAWVGEHIPLAKPGAGNLDLSLFTLGGSSRWVWLEGESQDIVYVYTPDQAKVKSLGVFDKDSGHRNPVAPPHGRPGVLKRSIGNVSTGPNSRLKTTTLRFDEGPAEVVEFEVPAENLKKSIKACQAKSKKEKKHDGLEEHWLPEIDVESMADEDAESEFEGAPPDSSPLECGFAPASPEPPETPPPKAMAYNPPPPAAPLVPAAAAPLVPAAAEARSHATTLFTTVEPGPRKVPLAVKPAPVAVPPKAPLSQITIENKVKLGLAPAQNQSCPWPPPKQLLFRDPGPPKCKFKAPPASATDEEKNKLRVKAPPKDSGKAPPSKPRPPPGLSPPPPHPLHPPVAPPPPKSSMLNLPPWQPFYPRIKRRIMMICTLSMAGLSSLEG